MAYIAYPNVPTISYQGFGGYYEQEECEAQVLRIENFITDLEIKRGKTPYVTVRCEEIYAFPSSIKDNKKISS